MIVSLRWSPVWCLPQRLRCQSQYQEVCLERIMQYDKSRNISEYVYVPSVGNVRVLYMLPWILTVVVNKGMLMPFLVMPPA